MNKIALILGIPICIIAILIAPVFMAMGGDTGVGLPLEPIATEEKAYQYQYIGSELGVPWDIVMLADAILAKEEGKDGIEDYNPMNTALEFCRIHEEEFEPVVQLDEEGNPMLNEYGEELIEWESNGNEVYYSGRKAILEYVNKKDYSYEEATELITDIQKVAEEKSTEEIQYRATLVQNPNYESVLIAIGLSEKDAANVLELYHANYLVYMYGYIPGNEHVELPDVVIGNVSRYELAQIAVSLINHPYQMGGKSPTIGPPIGPLDCSGFVDWVYVQCFGKSVSSGKLPEGVALSGTALQYYACTPIRESELKVGDLGFLYDPTQMKSGTINHVGIYIGKIDGRNAFVHCAGKRYGYDERPSGRVGISIANGINSWNPVTGETFAPAMKGCTFRYFRRPNFRFRNEED